MKKGLLSLLALALTVVGCQNYDDQFAELTTLVSDLQDQVTNLPDVTSDIEALQDLVESLSTTLGGDIDDLEGSIGDVQSVVDDLENYDDQAVLIQLGTLSNTLAELLIDVANADTSAELALISSTLADVQADVKEILAANAVINQDVTINDASTLDYVQNLISTDDDSPLVIVNGNVDFDYTDLTDPEVAEANIIANQIGSVLQNVTLNHDEAITINELTYIKGDYNAIGANHSRLKLKTVVGSVTIDHKSIDVDYSNITKVSGNVIFSASAIASAVTVDFSNTVIGGDLKETAARAAGVLDFPAAEELLLGSGKIVELTAVKADNIVSTYVPSSAHDLTVTATNGGIVSFNNVDELTALTITGGATTTFNFDALETTTSIDAGGSVKAEDVNLGALTKTGDVSIEAAGTVDISGLVETDGTIDIDADGVTITALASITTGNTVDLHESVITGGANLVSVEADLTTNVNPVNFPNAQFSAPLSTTATTVTVGGDALGDLTNVSGASVDFLTVNKQKVTVSDAPATLVTLDITATSATGGADENLTITSSAAALKGLTVTGFEVVTISNSALATVTTAGTIRDLIYVNSSAGSLAELNIGHTYSTEYTSAQKVEVTFANAALTEIDLTSVSRLEDAQITNNAGLTTITAPGTGDLLTAGATVDIEISANSLTATYTDSVAAVSNGITNTLFEEAIIVQPSFATWNTYLTAVSAINTITIDLDYDSTGFSTDTGADGGGTAMTGTINTLYELQQFVAQ